MLASEVFVVVLPKTLGVLLSDLASDYLIMCMLFYPITLGLLRKAEFSLIPMPLWPLGFFDIWAVALAKVEKLAGHSRRFPLSSGVEIGFLIGGLLSGEPTPGFPCQILAAR